VVVVGRVVVVGIGVVGGMRQSVSMHSHSLRQAMLGAREVILACLLHSESA
jgi:hypothetical protein